MSEVIWHDLECGGYDVDLPLWRALATEAAGAVLDVGAGSGRVALDLAAHGHDVTALDSEGELLAALAERAAVAGLTITTVCADARTFAIDGAQFTLILVPMQTVQLLGGSDGRTAFLRAARAHLAAGGLLALALADAFEGFDADHIHPPPPDVCEIGGVHYSSLPIAVRDEGTAVAIDRLRETLDASGAHTATGSTVLLDHLDAAALEAEAQALGFTVLAQRRVPATDEYVGSAVVVLRG